MHAGELTSALYEWGACLSLGSCELALVGCSQCGADHRCPSGRCHLTWTIVATHHRRHRPLYAVVRALAASNGNQGSQAATNGDRSFDYEVFVIGGGSAGVRCARVAATRGERGPASCCAAPLSVRRRPSAGHSNRASVSAAAGARVALCELPMAFVSSDAAGGVGGTCVLRGCVPKKLLLYASEAAADLATSRDLG